MVILRDTSFVDVEGLVRYVYRGEVDVQPERLPVFLRTAALLKIKGLAEQGLAKDDDQEDDANVEVLECENTFKQSYSWTLLLRMPSVSLK